ncbi:MAG: erg26, C-3 sterol dehydrogenase [Vezdaea aestivalis]|nr:MAG: erg26, C-3 sterol dehydrogenase [Vezdaea aestivalis]
MVLTGHQEKPLGKVLVVGGCGFLGHHIVNQLTTFNCTIAVLDLSVTRNRNPSPSVTYHAADITSKEALVKVFSEVKPDVVIHTASPTMVGSTIDQEKANELYRKVNIGGTKVLLEVSQENGVKAFVFTSTASLVSDNTGKMDIINADERWPVLGPTQQQEYYATTKAQAESEVLLSNSPSFQTCALRPAGIIGEGDVQYIAGLLRVWAFNQTRFQLGANENLFDQTHVGNVAYAHILAAIALRYPQPEPAPPVAGEAFFISNSSPVPFWDFARFVWAEASRQAPGANKPIVEPKDVWVIPRGPGLVLASVMEWGCWLVGKKHRLSIKEVRFTSMVRYYNCRKAMERLGYTPLYTTEEAAIQGVKWFFQNNRLRDIIGVEVPGLPPQEEALSEKVAG